MHIEDYTIERILQAITVLQLDPSNITKLKMDSVLTSTLLLQLHPCTLQEIWKKNYSFLEEKFAFLDGPSLCRELKTPYLVAQLCTTHGVEKKKTFPSFLRRWNLWYMFAANTVACI